MLWSICCSCVVSELKTPLQQRGGILSLSTTLLPKFSSVTSPALAHCIQAWGAEIHFTAMTCQWNCTRNMSGPALQRWCFSLSWGWEFYRFIHFSLSSSVEAQGPPVLGHRFDQTTVCHQSWPIAPGAEISRPADYVPAFSQEHHKIRLFSCRTAVLQGDTPSGIPACFHLFSSITSASGWETLKLSLCHELTPCFSLSMVKLVWKIPFPCPCSPVQCPPHYYNVLSLVVLGYLFWGLSPLTTPAKAVHLFPSLFWVMKKRI